MDFLKLFYVCMSNGLVNVISSGFKLVLSRSSVDNLYMFEPGKNAARSGFQTATVEVFHQSTCGDPKPWGCLGMALRMED